MKVKLGNVQTFNGNRFILVPYLIRGNCRGCHALRAQDKKASCHDCCTDGGATHVGIWKPFPEPINNKD